MSRRGVLRPLRLALSCGTAVMFGSDSVFFYPTDKVYGRPEDQGLVYEPLRIPTNDGLSLDAWFFPSRRANPLGTVVHLHGNAGNITGHFAHAAWLPDAGWNLLCFDYRGYGRSPGRPTRAGLVADCHAAIDAVKTRGDVDPARVVILGQSLGGALGIVATAQRRDVAGLAIDGAFSHYRRIAAWHIRRSPLLFALAWWMPRYAMKDGLDPIDHVAAVSPTPLFIMHGKLDDTVPAAMAQELFAAAAEPKELWLIDNIGHYVALDELADLARPKLLAFFEKCMSSFASRQHAG